MKIDWPKEWDYLYGNRVAIISGLTFLVSSAIKTLPTPGSTFDPYTWFYDWSHQFLNITNTRLTTASVPTPPESAPVPK